MPCAPFPPPSVTPKELTGVCSVTAVFPVPTSPPTSLGYPPCRISKGLCLCHICASWRAHARCCPPQHCKIIELLTTDDSCLPLPRPLPSVCSPAPNLDPKTLAALEIAAPLSPAGRNQITTNQQVCLFSFFPLGGSSPPCSPHPLYAMQTGKKMEWHLSNMAFPSP